MYLFKFPLTFMKLCPSNKTDEYLQKKPFTFSVPFCQTIKKIIRNVITYNEISYRNNIIGTSIDLLKCYTKYIKKY